MCYLNSKSNCTKFNGFSRIYTHRAGRRMHPRGSREGRVQMEWSEWDFHILGLGFEVPITGKEVLHCQRGRLSPCLLRRNASIWTRVPLECGGTSDHLECGAVSQLECGGTLGATAHLQDGVNIDLIHSPKDTCNKPFAESQPALYCWKMCSRAFSSRLVPPYSFPTQGVPSTRKVVERHTTFGPEHAIPTQKEKPLGAENDPKLKIYIHLWGSMKIVPHSTWGPTCRMAEEGHDNPSNKMQHNRI